MSERINLKELQRKAWRSMFQDGLWDIFLGLLLLNLAIFVWLDELMLGKTMLTVLFIGGEGTAFLLLWAGKRFVTIPRLGMAEFGQYGRVRRHKIRLLLFISVLVGLIVFLLFGSLGSGSLFAGQTRDYIAATGWVLNCLLVFGLAGYLLDFNRLYLIGFLYALPFPLDVLIRELSATDAWAVYTYALPALVIVTIGVGFFLNFLRKYPSSALSQ